MSKQSVSNGSNRPSPIRSLLAFRHQNPFGRLVSAIAAFGIAMLVIVGIGPAYAVHDTGKFELDGNIANNGNATYDWGNLFNASGGQSVTPDPNNGPLLASDFNSDAADPDPTYFTSNKDIESIADWGCTTINNPTPKDDLQNAYAALVQIPANAPDNAGHKVLYLASERQSNNGDSFAGFWLLKNNSVGCRGSGAFAGTHTDGDILVLSNYTNGGGTQDVQVYRWTGNDATGGPVAVPGLSGSTCGVASTDSACAIANSATITSSWSPTSHASNTFVEAGIDLNNLLDATGGGCFTNFIAETRSSQEITATLKDFAGGQFNTCPPAPLTTQASGGSTEALGSAQTDTATLSAVGNRPVPTGTVDFYLCQPSEVTAGVGCASGDGTKVGGSITVSGGSATSASTTDTATPGTYCWRAEYTPDSTAATNYVASSHTNDGSECFTVIENSPTITTQIQTTGTGLGFTTLGDQATLHGFFGTVTGETVTFKLYGPFAEGVTPTCTEAKLVATVTADLNSSGVATTAPADAYTPAAVGTYVWRASYPGDSNNHPYTERCNDDNESATIGGAQVSVTKSANPGGPVSAGTSIGFDITVTNDSDFPAKRVHVSDALPAGADGVTGGDLNWSLDPAYTDCAITGDPGSQVLDCTFTSDVPPGPMDAIHITSATTPHDCGVVSNQATVSTTNGTGGSSGVAHVSVQCPDVTFTKSADAASVTAGGQIGFKVTASNSDAEGTGTATGVVIDDPLPAGPGVDWSIAPGGPSNCSITGAPPLETLHCAAVDLAPGDSEVVHVVSATDSVTSCATYQNVATRSATNAAAPPASATTQVVNCVIVSPPIVSPPHPNVLPNTGGPNEWLLAAGLALLVGGGAIVMTGRRRRHRS